MFLPLPSLVHLEMIKHTLLQNFTLIEQIIIRDGFQNLPILLDSIYLFEELSS